jgi:hypothetical protein
MRVTLFFIAIILFAFGTWFASEEKAAGAGATYAAAAICLIFVFLSKFKRFKAFGLIDAELLEEKLEEADRLIKRLRGISLPIAELLFTIIARAGRWNSRLPNRDSYRITKKFEEELKKTGVTKSELEEAKKEWHRYNIIDLGSPVIKAIVQDIDVKRNAKQEVVDSFPQPITPEKQPEYKRLIENLRESGKFRKEALALYKLEDMDSLSEEINTFVKTCSLFDKQEREKLLSNNQEQIKDIEYYCKNHEFRRLDVWFEDK